MKGGDIGLNYLVFSKYFIANMVALAIYPYCRYFRGMRQTAVSFNEDFVSKSLDNFSNFDIRQTIYLTLHFPRSLDKTEKYK